jgi:bifunctional non-homologous end joining protein LigD
MSIQETTLYFRQNGSDKVYRAAIEETDGGFVVNFEFGRRGSALKAGTKTASPVDRAAAVRIYEKLVNEKLAKGYTPGEDGTPYAGGDLAGQVSGFNCQLLSVADFSVEAYVQNSAWLAQEKFDGERCPVQVNCETGEARGINRRGLFRPLPEPVAVEAGILGRAFRDRATTIIFDGELIGDRWVVFDLAASRIETDASEAAGGIQDQDFLTRYQRLAAAFAGNFSSVMLAPLAQTDDEKARLVAEVRERNGEGIVFKRKWAAYAPGRSLDALKVKFIETASVIVGKPNASKRSVSMLVQGPTGELVECGNVSIPANHPIPPAGAIVEVSYLYVFPESNRLYQPIFKGERTDIPETDCVLEQFKFKA